jgi:coenzyme F420 hydrogenase subunit beta
VNTERKQNISSVAVKKLCNTCGACFAVCTFGAIKYQETVGGYYFPVVDEAACNHCALCYAVCPGIHFGDTLTAQMPDDPFSGQALEAYVGKSTDKKIFDNSQSGGIVSAVLIHALETGRIKGAATVYMQPGIRPRPVVRIARSNREICEAQKSKYCPVPLLSFLKDLKEEDGPVAVVGISCQMHGLRNILDMMPKLQSKIAFTVGLVCDRVLTYAALDYLVAKSGVDKSIASLLHFRDKSVPCYPGDVHVISDNGKSCVMPSSDRTKIKDYFTPARCRICFDKMNIFPDITVGDPHGLKGVDRKLGESMLVVRTENGRDVVHSARNGMAIDIRSIQYVQVLKGQGIDRKREQWRGYIEAWKQNENEIPNYYEMVKEHASVPAKIKKYLRDLQYSLNLDNYSSRDELIHYVQKSLRKKQLVSYLFYPVVLSKWVIGKLSILVSGR